MKRTATALTLVFVFLAAANVLAILPVKAEPRTITVPSDYSTVFEAVENARDSDTIIVKRGTFEGPTNQTLIISKTISIIGENPQTTKLVLHPEWITQMIFATQLSYYANPIKIEANNVRISGLTITSDGGEISAAGNETKITGNILRASTSLRGSFQLFAQNTLIGSDVTCRGTNASISENVVLNGMIGSDSGWNDKIFSNNVTGSVAIGGTSTGELVYGNIVRNGGNEYWAGISIASIGASVINNTVDNCSRGMSMDWGSDNTARGNFLTNNRLSGLKVTDGDNFVFEENYVSSNPVGVQTQAAFALSHNNFVNNDLQVEVLDDKMYFWHMDNGEEGNFWSNYRGTDADGDGIGDTPFNIFQNCSDRYPLMSPVKIDQSPIDLTRPIVDVQSFEKTIYTNTVNLAFIVSEPTSWIGYCLDGKENITISGNFTLIGLPNGLHDLTVYANDTYGNMGASETVSFTVAAPEPFPIVPVAAVVTVVILTAVLLPLILRKRHNSVHAAEHKLKTT